MADAYGLLAEFDSPEALTAAAKQAREAGYRRLDAFTPFPVKGLAQILRLPRPKISWVGLIGGFSGGGFAFLMQCYTNYDFPLNVGGRPLYAFSAFAVVMFELTILFSALSMIVAMLWQNGLPRLNYPLFGARASIAPARIASSFASAPTTANSTRTRPPAFCRRLGAASVERVPR